MPERTMQGAPASPGAAVGPAWQQTQGVEIGELVPAHEREHEREVAHAALAGAAGALGQVAAALPPDEAAIIEASVLMAGDPALLSAVDDAIVTSGLPAGQAIMRAAGQLADAIASLGDELLAARADDVRSLGRRAARLTTTPDADAPRDSLGPRQDHDCILIANDIGPADVAEHAPRLAGIALVGGGATAHAAIVARSLGIPMVTSLPGEILEVADGTHVALDGAAGSVVVEPSAAGARAAAADMRGRRLAAQLARSARDQPAVTSDGRRIRVLSNVSSAAEVDVGFGAGAEGIGLLRTELAFLDAAEWPSEREHRAALEPILAGLEGRPAVVRVLDFGADKTPPFLRGVRERGLELLLANAEAFEEQLRAILVCATGRDVRILLPLVDHPEEVVASGALIRLAADALGIETLPPIGSMIETPRAAQNAWLIAQHSAFLSIGTNDLTAATLGADRFAANSARAYDPRVLRSIARTVVAAHDAGIALEVCGEAASDPVMLPLLVGLGVDEVSVGAARVGEVRGWIRGLNAEQAEAMARSALTLDSPDEVARAARSMRSAVPALSA
ncbi:MAG TPA: putative PEP-binding protein [Solirubrobacteraceae bacterium]|nr:putative PEP-binding protein [Solirubrobacteraceae bacterium]